MLVVPAISTAHSAFYRLYIHSQSWRSTRNRARQRANYQCQRCGRKRDLEVHHLTYDRLGHEWDEDLTVLCTLCHRLHHLGVVEASPSGVYLKLGRQAIRERGIGSIADLNAAIKALCARNGIPPNARAIDSALRV